MCSGYVVCVVDMLSVWWIWWVCSGNIGCVMDVLCV